MNMFYCFYLYVKISFKINGIYLILKIVNGNKYFLIFKFRFARDHQFSGETVEVIYFYKVRILKTRNVLLKTIYMS